MRIARSLLLVILFGCSSEGSSASPPASGAAASASAAGSAPQKVTVTDKDRENILAFFAEVGDRTAAAMQKVGDSKPKSRVTYVEPLTLATPGAFPLHADLFEKKGLDLEVFTEAMSDPAFEKEALAKVQQKVEPHLKEMAAANLPELHADDCVALARRLVELVEGGGKTAPLRGPLSQSMVKCVSLLPKHVSDCLPEPRKPSTLEAYDACVAKGAPAKK